MMTVISSEYNDDDDEYNEHSYHDAKDDKMINKDDIDEWEWECSSKSFDSHDNDDGDNADHYWWW